MAWEWWEDITGQTAAKASKEAAGIQAQAGREALGVQKGIYEQSRADMMPWMESGRQNLATLQGLMGEGAFDAPEFQFDFEADPGYQFRREEGMRGIERSAAGRGGLASGATLAGLMERNQGLASQAYQGAYGRYLDKYRAQTGARQDRFNRFSNLAGMGQTQSQSLGNLGQGYGQQYGQGRTGIGNAQAAGVMGAAQARQQGASNLGNLAMQGLGAAATFWKPTGAP